MSTATTPQITLDDDKLRKLQSDIIEAFVNRAEYQGYGSTKTKKFKQAEADFFAGAMAALVAIGMEHNQAMPPNWVITIMRGGSITDKT